MSRRKVGEHEGAVARLTSRATILISLDGNHVRIPNSTVYKSVVVNYTRNPERRFEFTVGVDTGHDLNEAREVALEAVHEVPGVLDSQPASVIVEDLGDSNVTLTVMGWMDQTTSDVRKVRSEAIRFVKQAFDEAGIVMPEPIYRVNLRTSRAGLLTDHADVAPLEPSDAGRHDPVGGFLGGSDDERVRGTGKALPDGPSDASGERPPDRRPADEDERRSNVPTPPLGVPPSSGRVGGQGQRRRPRPRPATRDTSLDRGVTETLEREIEEGAASNLLDADAPRE